MNQPETIKIRLQKVDLFRGLALIGMVVYHFSWDLSYFSYIDPQVPAEGSLRVLARIVAFCFLFISGFSLYLAQGKQRRFLAYFRRLSIIILAAFVVSIVTYFIMPQGFIYFGILHEIAVATVIGLLFLHTPLVLNFLAIFIFVLLPFILKSDFFNAPYLLWIGFSSYPRPSLDYVPVFPWFGSALLGLTTARICDKFHLFIYLQNGIRPQWLNKSLQLIGRHSLIFYLVHQPVLLALLYCISAVFPPSPDTLRKPLERACVNECSESQADSHLCTAFCSCVFDQIDHRQMMSEFSRGEVSQTDERLQKSINACWGQTLLKQQ
ncbi:putative membrane protein [Bartonella apihabitans]|uniref:DUF1624 domain-containing protein n=1 Tax=Bartonella apihabitans TaxID=2750929 RepID=UPI00098F7EC6|nr:heparan-alpha-glucosaminide N-acetyltransferase [Bartonella apihabitans]AQT44686.1 putative membrane protein [Bartonella apihabitans]